MRRTFKLHVAPLYFGNTFFPSLFLFRCGAGPACEYVNAYEKSPWEGKREPKLFK